MNKRAEEWLRLTGQHESGSSSRFSAPFLMLNLNGIQHVEDKFLLYRTAQGDLPPQLSSIIDDVSKDVFGITENDTLFEFPDVYDSLPDWSNERFSIDEQYDLHEERFETTDATDDEAVVILLGLGLDFRDARGNPLLSTKFFCRQAEAAAKGILGKMPDRNTSDLESWTKKMESEAKLHLKNKRAS